MKPKVANAVRKKKERKGTLAGCAWVFCFLFLACTIVFVAEISFERLPSFKSSVDQSNQVSTLTLVLDVEFVVSRGVAAFGLSGDPLDTEILGMQVLQIVEQTVQEVLGSELEVWSFWVFWGCFFFGGRFFLGYNEAEGPGTPSK
jgi:hypothetical protein